MSSLEAAQSGPPVERHTRFGSPLRKHDPVKLTDLDGSRMPSDAFYKTMSLDIVEGHQIGLYRKDGSVKYPLHHALAGSDAAFTARAREPLCGSVVYIQRKRPASANPEGRQISPESVRDVMCVHDIDGTRSKVFHRQRKENNILNTSDLAQRTVSPKRSLGPPISLQTVDDGTREEGPMRDYYSLHKYTRMHRPHDAHATTVECAVTSGQQPTRPKSAAVAGRAPYSDPLNPVYFLAASSAALLGAATTGRSQSPKHSADSSQVRSLIHGNTQPCPSQPLTCLTQQTRLDSAAEVVVSMPINGDAKKMTRKAAGQYRAVQAKSEAAAIMHDEGAAAIGRSESPAPTAAPWNKLAEASVVNKKSDAAGIIREKLQQMREAATAQAKLAQHAGGGDSTMRHTDAYIDYSDVPFGSSDWKLRLVEERSAKKLAERASQDAADRAEEQSRVAASRPKDVNPLVPDYPELGASSCSTATTHYTAFTQAHIDAVAKAAKAGASSRRRIPLSARHLGAGEHTGTEACDDIVGARADPAWKVPPTADALRERVRHEMNALDVLSAKARDNGLVLTGVSCPSPTKRGVLRPSSATVRTASTGHVARDQREAESDLPVGAAATKSSNAVAAGSRVTACRPQSAGLARRDDGVVPKKHEISELAAAMHKFGMLRSAADTSIRNAAVAAVMSKARATVRPPPHAASRKELLYQKDIASVRSLPNFV